MNYLKIYISIIENRRGNPYNGYVEKHHILPRSLGGSDRVDNLVCLSAREHFICHLLLTKIHRTGISHLKMVKAFSMMCMSSSNQERHKSSYVYKNLKEKLQEAQRLLQSGEKNSRYATKWIHSIELRKSKSIGREEAVPDGWFLGRVLDFDMKLSSEIRRREKEQAVGLRRQKNIEKYAEYYRLYNKLGFDSFKEVTGYNFSKPALIQGFIKYVSEFTPQNGKKRGRVK